MEQSHMRRIIVFSFMVVVLLAPADPIWGWIDVCNLRQDQWQPAVAFAGGQFLVAWTDLREVPSDPSTNVYGARVAVDGTVLDPEGFLIAHGPEEQMMPRIGAGPQDWLVIWQEGC
jgi:hypothetical protein